MLEIFALCSCACLACLWCAIALELTKNRYSRKNFYEMFGTNCLKCAKDRRCAENEVHILRNTSNRNTHDNDNSLFKHGKIKEIKKAKQCKNRKDNKKKVDKKLNSHRLSPITMLSPILPCQVCCRVKHGCECSKDKEKLPSFDISIHNSSCPNLIFQERCHHRPPIRLSYYSLSFDPSQRTPNAIFNTPNMPNLSNIPFMPKIPFTTNTFIPNIPNIPNTWKDYTQGRSNFRRNRYFSRKRKERRN